MYPHNKTFATQAEQEHYIRDWLSQRAGLAEEADKLNILFYPGKYHAEFGSIFSTGDVPALIPDPDADALILEEPEHLNWYVRAMRAESGTDLPTCIIDSLAGA